MKKVILLIAIVFSGMLAQAQTDLDIVNSIIGNPFSEFENTLKEMGLEYYITSEYGKNILL